LIHELKTPLTSLIATSQLLYDETQVKKSGSWPGTSGTALIILNNRIDELQDVLRGETGILKLALKPIDIGQLLQSLVDENQALAKQNGIH
jgi:signal transduction histidine kinase